MILAAIRCVDIVAVPAPLVRGLKQDIPKQGCAWHQQVAVPAPLVRGLKRFDAKYDLGNFGLQKLSQYPPRSSGD